MRISKIDTSDENDLTEFEYDCEIIARKEAFLELNQFLDKEMAKSENERNYDMIERLLHDYADVLDFETE